MDGRVVFDLIRSCQRGQQEAIVAGIEDTGGFWNELYVETTEDRELQEFFLDEYAEDGTLLLVTGSAGDGKSALLSRAYQGAKAVDGGIPADRINMDATASNRKSEPYYERLDRFLGRVVSDMRDRRGPRAAVAINFGLAIDFFQRRGYAEQYPELWETLQKSRGDRSVENGEVEVLNLSHRRTFENAPEEFGQGLLTDILDQFDVSNTESPFREAYQHEREACPAGDECPLHRNLEWFTDPAVRQRAAEIIAAWSVVSGTYLNPRTILDTIGSALIPPEMQELAVDDADCPVGAAVADGTDVPVEAYFWNSLFEELDWDDQRLSGYVDPAAQETQETSQRVLEWSADTTAVHQIDGVPSADGFAPTDLIRTALRAEYLQTGDLGQTLLDWSWFDEYLAALAVLSADAEDAELEDREAGPVYETIRQALRGWTGADDGGDRIEFADGLRSLEYRFYSEWETPRPNIEASRARSREETAPGRFWMVLKVGGLDERRDVPLPLTFDLYVLMKRIIEGYTPNTTDLDRSEAIRMIQERLSDLTAKDEFVAIRDKAETRELTIEDTGFGTTVEHEVYNE